MKITITPGLEALATYVESYAGDAVKERERLGMTLVRHLHIDIALFDSVYNGIAATNSIIINALPTLYSNLEDDCMEMRYDTNRVKTYFTELSSILDPVTEDVILRSTEDPKAFLKELKGIWKNMNRGDYIRCRSLVSKEGEEIGRILRALLPDMVRELARPEIMQYFIRHEYDHVAYFLENGNRIEPLADWLSWIESDDDLPPRKRSKELRTVAHHFLEAMLLEHPKIEQRAIYFHHIAPGGWADADIDKVKNDVFQEYCLGYVDGAHLNDIAGLAIRLAGGMDDDTMNYIHHQVLKYDKAYDHSAFCFEPDEVDMELANRIIYESIPQIKQRFRRQAYKVKEELTDYMKIVQKRYIEAGMV